MLKEDWKSDKTLINSTLCTTAHIQNKNEYIIRNTDKDFGINIEKIIILLLWQ